MMALPLALMLALASVGFLRAGWGRDRRLSWLGWASAAVSVGWLAALEGAWGVATGFVVAMAVALAFVLHAALVAPAGKRRVVADPSVSLPGEMEGLGRRAAVFALVVPVAFFAAQWFAFALNTAMKAGGPLEANSVATMFMVQPVVWTLLMAWQMTREGPREMIAGPALVASAGLLIWIMA